MTGESNGKRMELWKQVVASVGAIAVAGIGAWQAVRLATPEPAPAPVVERSEPPVFVTDFVLDSAEVRLRELEIHPDLRLPASNEGFVNVRRVEYGELDGGDRAFSVRVVLRNVSDRPIQLDLSPRFFSLLDDQGREADLVHFCCEASGELLPVKGERTVRILFRAPAGWEGKDVQAERIDFRVRGLFPVVRAVWSFAPLLTAA